MRKPRDEQVRLQKFLSDAGVASRRQAEELILAGQVLVNDHIVDTLPAFIDPEHDRVIANGVPVRAQRHEYFILHKPKGVVCTNHDPAGRIRAVDLLPDLPVRLFPVGRLDVETTGLLLMTNDGELTEQLTHPRFGIPKTYRAEVRGQVPADLPAQMKKGIYLAEGKAQASEVAIVHASRDRSVLTVTLREGRNRQVRRMLARLGFPVKTLKRLQIGPLSLRALPLGAARRLSDAELKALRKEVEAHFPATAAARRPRRTAGTGGPRRRRPDDASPRPTRPTRERAATAKPARTKTTTRRKPAAAPTTERKPPAKPSRRLIT